MTTTMSQPVKCLGCGRKLKAKASVAQGRGPRCQERHVARLTALTADAIAALPEVGFTADQRDKASDLIEDKAILPAASSAPGLYIVVSGNGLNSYATRSNECTCTAGRYGRTCYHRAAAIVLDFVRSAA